MCGGVHYGEVEGLVSVERWSCVPAESVESGLLCLLVVVPLRGLWAVACHLTLCRANC